MRLNQFVALLALSFFASLALKGQESNIVGFYSPVIFDAKNPVPSAIKEKLVIPYTKAGNLILIEAKVDGKSGYFILDTGAPYLVLNATYFRKYPRTRQFAAVGVNNTEIEIFRTQVDELNIRSIKYQNVEADVADLGHIENSRNKKILGLLGTNLFKEFVLAIDAVNQNITFYNPTYFEMEKKGLNLNPISLNIKNNTLALDAKINEETVRLVFDTGAEINVLDNNLKDEVYEPFIIQKRSLLNGSVGNEIEVFSGILMRLDVGTMPFMQMRTIMTNLQGLGKVYGYRVDGILGHEFLIRTKVWIDFSKSTLYVEKKKFYE